MFKTPLTLDRRQILSTVLVSAFAFPLLAAMVLFGPKPAYVGAWVAIVALVGAFAMAPRELVVSDSEVCIKRRLWPALHIARSEVEHVSIIDSLGRGVVRVGGTGGYFGSYGFFRSNELGSFRLYATRRGPALHIARRSGVPIVVTPDDLRGAVAAIEARPHVGLL